MRLKSFGHIIYRIGILKILLKERPNIFVVYANPRDISCFIALFFASLLGIKTAAYGMFHRIGKLKLFTRLAYRIFYSLSDLILVYSRKGATVLYAMGLDQKKVIIVGNAIDETKIKAYKKPEQLPTMNLKANVVLQIVRLSKIKNPIILVEAAKFVVEDNPDVSFVIVGLGEEYNRFKAKITELGLKENFLMMGAIYDEKELSKLFALASVSVVPSCIGLSLHHSFAYSVPVITDDSVETQTSEFDIVLNGINALTYESGNAKDLANCLVKILSDNKFQKRLSKASRQTILNGNRIADKARRFSRILK